MYLGRVLGERKYYVYSKVMAIIGMIGATAGFVAVLMRKFK